MKKLLTFAALTTIALVSCNNDNDNVPATVGDDVIRFGAEALNVTTKAPFEGVISGSNTLTAHVLGSANIGNYSANSIYVDKDGAQAKGVITFNDNGVTESSFDTGVKWPTTNTQILYFRGFYPSESVWTVGATSAEATIDGMTDLMSAPEIKGTKASVDENPLKFKFAHLLTKLHVKVQGNAATAKDWGNVVKIELSKALNDTPSNQLIYTYSGEAISFGGGQSIPFYLATENNGSISYTDDQYANQDYLVPTSSTLVAYSLVAPVEAVAGNLGAKDEYALNITTTKGAAISGKDVAINLKGTNGKDYVGSTAGKKFDITIQFLSEGQITATATVTDWVDGGSGNGQI